MYLNIWRCLVIIWLSTAALTRAQSQIEFQIAPSNRTIATGSPITFYCQVATTSSGISLSWRHDGVAVVLDNRTQQSILPNGTLQLTINPTMEGDDGNYSCVVTVTSTQQEHTRTAYLQFAFIIGQFVRHPESKTVTLGDPGQFFCIQDRSLPLAEIIWLRDGMLLPVSSSGRYLVQSGELLHDMGRVSSSLLIYSVRSSDAGLYGCRAVNPLQPNNPVYSNNASLTVEVLPAPPSFLVIPSSIILPAAGVSSTFSCSVTGSPIPSITWLHNNNVISNNDSITITTQEQLVNTTLTIASVQQSDTGDYQCRAENNGGSITSDPGTLQIASISQMFQMQPPASVLAVFNTTTVIPCGPPISIPPATVEWSRDFSQLINSRFIIDGTNLTILNTQLSDSGIYRCNAINPLTTQSVVSQGANVSVKVTPQFTLEPTNGTAALNGAITFSCEASGDPNPSVVWYGNQILISGTDSRLQVIGGDLSIDPVMLSDDGSFTCEASNIVGVIQSTVHLNVEYPPEIFPSFVSSVTAIEGNDVLMNCSAVGNPTPRVTWWRGTEELLGVLSNGSILLSSVQTNNEGNYTCRAANSLGSTEATLSLIIQEPAAIIAEQSNVTVVEGQSVSLTCRASGDPPPLISWYDSDGNLLTDQGSRISISNGILTFSPAAKADEGVITCVATNRIRNSSADILLRVLVVPRIIQPANSSDVVLIEGNVLLLECSASGDPAPVVTWVVPSYTESQGADRLSTFTNGTLILSNVLKLDEGVYQCVAINDAGSDSVNVTVTVWVPTVAETPSSHTATRGRNGILDCQASGDPEPSISWLRNGTLLVNSIKYAVLQNGSLWIRDIEDSDAGNYSCQAMNIAGIHLSFTNLIIYVIPAVVIPNPQVTGVQGQSLVLQCMASGFPNPTITWHFNMRQITAADAPRLSVTPDSGLIINGVITNDDGLYQCVATNPAGSDMGTVNLTIYVPPTVEAAVDRITEVQGNTVILSCTATGIPTPTIVWMHNGAPVVTQGSRVMVGSGSLTFDPVSNDDEGAYQCLAQNSAGTNAASITLTVLVPPRITQGPVNATVSEGDSAILTCRVNGDPPPAVSWTFNDQVIVVNSSVLMVSVVTRADTGYYTCTATNSVGTSSSSAYLNVFYSPVITQGPTDATVTENSSVSFTCEADANPLAEFQWLLDNRRLTSSDASVNMTSGQLMITMVSEVHAGMVACVAVNTEGTITSIATLTVLFRPTAPVNVIATVLSATSMRLQWTQPVDDGGANITNYIITYHSNAEDHMSISAMGFTIQLDGLAPYATYQIQVSAENFVGISSPSTTVNATTLIGAPSSPRSLRIAASTETSVTLSWMPPDPPNGPLSIYQISYNEEGTSASVPSRLTTSTTSTISSLQADVVYVVSVRGSTISEDNSLLFGSAASLRIMNGMVLPLMLPTSSSVMTSSLVVMSSVITLSSSQPSLTTATTSTRRTTSSTLVTVISTATMTTSSDITSLPFAGITTSTATTTSAFSLSAVFTTTGMVPSSTIVSSSPSSETATIISTSITVALSSTPTTVSSTSSIATTSSSITAITSPTPLLPPSAAPQWIAVQSLSRGTIYLFWSFAGGTVDGYIVTIVPAPPNSAAGSRNTTDTSLTVEGLADYTNYTFTVAAYNAAGVGPATPPETELTNEGVPTATRNVTVERVSFNSIRVSWEPPEFINGILVMYTVCVMRESSTIVIRSSMVNATESNDVITGLEPGSYFIIVVASTGAGEGIPSDPIQFTLMATTITITSTSTLSAATTSVLAINNTVLVSQPASTSIAITISDVPVETTVVSASLTPSVNVTAGEDSNNILLVEAIIPAVAVVIIIVLIMFVVVLCYRRRRTSRKNRRYKINVQSRKPRQQRLITEDKTELVPYDDDDADYFSGVHEALSSNFAFTSDDGDEMHAFGKRPSNDYSGPPLIPEDELEHSSEDEFDGPYATADQVAQREKKHMQGHQNVTDSSFKQSTFDTQSNRSSNSGTYVSSDSVRAKKRQSRMMSLARNATISSKGNDDDDDDTGFSPLPAGTLKLDSENSFVNSDVSSND